MRLSVIIPCFNAADTIAGQLEALAQQHWSQSWEIIVADNGSTDHSLAIVAQYQKHLPHLRIVDASAQRGAAYARNVGVSAAQSEALAFCDADDEVAPGWIAAMGEALTQYDFVGCRFDPYKLNEPWVVNSHPHVQETELPRSGYLPNLLYAGGGSIGIKRALHEAIGGFDESILRLEDVDYCWRAQLAGAKLHFVADAVLYVRHRPSLAGMYRQARMWAEFEVMLYKKHLNLGMPRYCWKYSLRSWVNLLKEVKQIHSLEGRRRWFWRFAWRCGRLQGSIKYRVWAV
jgi:glycosyltransferase involved in cell wall biosynthesis